MTSAQTSRFSVFHTHRCLRGNTAGCSLPPSSSLHDDNAETATSRSVYTQRVKSGERGAGWELLFSQDGGKPLFFTYATFTPLSSFFL